MYVKLFSSILDSSVWDEDLPTKVLWITMLAMADEEGVVGASVGGLARRAGISREECERGLDRFIQPDPDSRSEEFEGRRIEKVDGGWRLLNHARYREIRTRRQEKEAARQARHRDRVRAAAGDVTVTGVTERDTSRSSRATPPTASASASVSESTEKDQEKDEPAVTDAPTSGEPVSVSDPLDEVLIESGLDLGQFDEAEAKLIRGFLRGQRSPFAVSQVLRAHLTGEEKVAPHVLALAVREYAALAEPQFRSRHFAGFVKRARTHVVQQPSRVQSRNEERFITAEDVEREREKREAAETDEMLREFERTNGEQYAALVEQAERAVDPKWKGMIRAPMVKAKLAALVREARNNGSR